MQQAVDFLERLVAMDTVSSRPVTALSAMVAERLETLGFRVERFDAPGTGKHNLVASLGPTGTDGLALSGHMDVVPVDGQPWTTDPFIATTRTVGGEARIYGRGTADMKGFLAATLSALSQLNLSDVRREIVLIWTCDEEVGCLGSAALAEQLLAEGRPLPRACVIGEPTSFTMHRMHPGHVATELTFHGRAAHSSRPDLGVNAIEAAAAGIASIRSLAERLATERAFEGLLARPWVAVNTASISGGTAVNIVPDLCTVRVGYRPLPGTDPEAVHRRLLAAARSGGARVDGRVLRVTPAMLTQPHSGTFALLHSHADGEREGATSFATDGGNLARLSMEPLVFGPGSIEVAHKADEFLPAADLARAVSVVKAIVRARCLTG